MLSPRIRNFETSPLTPQSLSGADAATEQSRPYRAVLKLVMLVWSFSILAACSAEITRPSPANQIIIENVTAIDAKNGPRAAVDIHIADGKILSVIPHDATRQQNGQRIDGTDKFLIPGLWDAHVHLAYTPGLDHNVFYPLALAHGVTSLRDTGGHLDLLAPAIKAAKQNPVSPSFYFSGPLIDGPQRVYDGRSASTPDLSVGVSTPEEAIRTVDELAAAGADLIKAYEMLSPEAFRAVAARAKELGLPVAAHTPLSMSVLESIEAGANDMQHLRNIEFACADNAEELLTLRQNMLAAADADTSRALRSSIHRRTRTIALTRQDDDACASILQALSSARVFQTPTLVISRFSTRKLFSDEAYRKSFDLLPPKIAAEWKDRSGRMMNMQPDAVTSLYDDWLLAMIPRLKAANVPIMAGTDAPIGFLTPGASLHEELFELVKAGLTPLEAIEAATYTPAEFFALTAEIGTIAPGQQADLVLLNENPLENIRHIQKIDAVFKNGILLDREDLDELRDKPSQGIVSGK